LFYIADEENDNDVDNFLKENNIDTYAFYVKSNEYEIISQAKYDKFNYIKLTCGGQFKWENLISHFDLNCIKIGVSKEGEEFNLIIQNEFLDFLNNREILILNAFNLESSIPRSLRKVSQYPFLKFNLNYFIKKYLIKSSHWFHLEEIKFKEELSSENKNKMISLLSQDNRLSVNENGFLFNYVPNDLSLKEYSSLYGMFGSFFESHSYVYLKNNEINSLIKIKKIHELIDKTNSKKTKEHELKLFIKTIIFDNNFIFKNFKDEDMYSIINFFNKHDNKYLFTNIKRIYDNINNWNDFLIFFRQLKRNDILIAFCENTWLLGKGIDSFDKLIKAKIIEDNKDNKFKYKPFKTLFWFSKYIHELSTEQELFSESKKMSHCVKGYWYQINRGKQRIFHINYKGNHSTLALDAKNGRILQHKSYKNRKPENLNIILGKLLSKNYSYFY